MSAGENMAAARRIYEALGSGDLDTLDEDVAPDFIEHNPEIDQEPGREGLKRSMAEFRTAFPDLHIEIEDMVATETRVVSRAKITGTHTGPFLGDPPTGRRFRIEMIDMIRLEEGRAAERWSVYEGPGVRRQLGLVSEPA